MNLQAPKSTLEKEVARLGMSTYDIYRPNRFGPVDVIMRQDLGEVLNREARALMNTETYMGLEDRGKRRMLTNVLKDIVREYQGTAFDRVRQRVRDGEETRFDENTVDQFQFETTGTSDERAQAISFFKRDNELPDDYLIQPEDFTLLNEYLKATRKILKRSKGGYIQKFNEGGMVGDPLSLSETAEEEDPIAREQAGDEYLRQMTELGLDTAPVTGEIRSAQGALEDFEQGNYGMSALGVLGAVPVVGAPARAVRRGLGAKKLLDDLPPPEAAQKTQIPGTLPTYVKAKQKLDTIVPEGKTLDFGAGLGLGAKEMGADSYEPFAREGFMPTFTKSNEIPSESYEKVTNLNVLNVVPKEVRDDIVKEIGRVLKPGGTAVITTRGKDVMKAKGREGPEENSIITSAGTYQKGFTKPELEEYVKDTLGEGYEVKRLNLGPAGVTVTKKQ
jgi:hypothetical protein